MSLGLRAFFVMRNERGAGRVNLPAKAVFHSFLLINSLRPYPVANGAHDFVQFLIYDKSI